MRYLRTMDDMVGFTVWPSGFLCSRYTSPLSRLNYGSGELASAHFSYFHMLAGVPRGFLRVRSRLAELPYVQGKEADVPPILTIHSLTSARVYRRHRPCVENGEARDV